MKMTANRCQEKKMPSIENNLKYIDTESLNTAHRMKDVNHTRGIPTLNDVHRFERAKSSTKVG